mmetsp:Transcript_2886/g.8974  ORF Transcript_2886/g.8974 Transcript_2886/m.8974 type:complete len:465 (-) Transcript_2886:907-2301(-)
MLKSGDWGKRKEGGGLSRDGVGLCVGPPPMPTTLLVLLVLAPPGPLAICDALMLRARDVRKLRLRSGSPRSTLLISWATAMISPVGPKMGSAMIDTVRYPNCLSISWLNRASRYASGTFTALPVLATSPTMPEPFFTRMVTPSVLNSLSENRSLRSLSTRNKVARSAFRRRRAPERICATTDCTSRMSVLFMSRTTARMASLFRCSRSSSALTRQLRRHTPTNVVKVFISSMSLPLNDMSISSPTWSRSSCCTATMRPSKNTGTLRTEPVRLPLTWSVDLSKRESPWASSMLMMAGLSTTSSAMDRPACTSAVRSPPAVDSVNTRAMAPSSPTRNRQHVSASMSCVVKFMMPRARRSSSRVSSESWRAMTSIASALRRCHFDSRNELLLRMNMPATRAMFSSSWSSTVALAAMISAAAMTTPSALIGTTIRSCSRWIAPCFATTSRSPGTAKTADCVMVSIKNS